jgi:outer membrane receptor protein involved in Fe transport
LTGVVDQHNVSCWGRIEGRWRPGENVPTIQGIKLHEHQRTSLLQATPLVAASVMSGRALVTAVTLIFICFVGAAGAQDAAPTLTDSAAKSAPVTGAGTGPGTVPGTAEDASASATASASASATATATADEPTTVAAPKATAPVVEEEVPVGPPPGVEVMQVKGRAVSGIETDVPESITQFDADTIAALGAGSIADLAKVTPNVEIRSAGATTAVFFIRGVGLSDFSSNAAGAVAVYQDNVPLNTPALQVGQLYDVLTVDVKSGPQGSGLYRNASAGAIMTYTRKPEGEYSAKIKSMTGSVWSPDAIDAFMRDTQGYVNIPLIDGTLASRMAFRISRADPFMTNGCANAPAFEDRDVFDTDDPALSRANASICGERNILPLETSRVPPGLKSKVGDRNVWDARGGLRFTPPGTDMDWWLSIHGGRLDQDSTLGQTAGTGNVNGTFGDITRTGYVEPDQFEEFQEIKFDIADVNSEAEFLAIDDRDIKSDATTQARAILGRRLAETRPLDRRPYRGDYNKVGRTTRDTFGGFLRGEVPVSDRINLTTITAYESYERFRDSDPDFTPDVLFETLTEDDSQQFTQDVKLDGKAAEGAIRWSTGAAFIQEELNNLSLFDLDTPFGPIRRQFKQETTAVMIYTEAAFDFLEDFTLEIGARYNYETKSFRIGELTQAQFGEFFNEGSKTWREPTGKISLTYHINDTTQMYIKYSRGYKVGHFNSNSRLEADSPARAEFIDAFEWGYKGGWWDGRVQSRGAFFYYRYNDYQVFVFQDNPGAFTPPTLVIRNAEAVEQYGLEVSVNIEPLRDFVPDEIDGLKMIFRFGWIESQFLKFTNIVFRDNLIGETFPVALDYAGNQLINSPQFKASATFEWPFDLGEFGTLKPRYDVEWSDDIFFDPNEGRGSLDIDGEPIQPKFALGQRAWWIHNIRLSYLTPVGNVEVSGWVRNILDQRVKTYAFDASFFGQAVINFVGQPRTAGADVTITW